MKDIFKTKHFISSLLIAIGIVIMPFATNAQSLGGYTFESMEVFLEIEEDATLNIVEEITVDFSEERHGIYRYIPIRYLSTEIESDDSDVYRVTEISNLSVVDEGGYSYDVLVEEDDNLFVRIGDPDVTITGKHVYIVSYTIDGALAPFDTYDELYWNITGNDWGVYPNRVRAQIDLPFAAKDTNTLCFTGVFGSTETNCRVSSRGEQIVVNADNTFLTVATSWPKGLIDVPELVYEIDEPGFFERLGQTNADIFALLIPILVWIFMHRRWKEKGKDPKSRGTIVPEYEPPHNLRPAEMYFLVKKQIRSRDIAASIIDLAVRGYISIKENESKGAFKKKTYSLKREKPADDNLLEWEKFLYDTLFTGKKDTSSQKELEKRFATRFTVLAGKIRDRVRKELGYVDTKSGTERIIFVGLGILILMLGTGIGAAFHEIFGRSTGGFAIMLTGSIVLIYGWIMARYTREGAEAKRRVLGYKMFIEKAETYRSKWQEKEHIFERVLPFAIAFGLTGKWANAFKKVKGGDIDHPYWYVGMWSAANANSIVQSVESITSSIASVAHAHSSSGGSSGGGFSGGGGGGGGGGSW